MPNLQTTSAAQLLRATGNAGLEIANVRKGQKGNAPADSVANMGENFQRQIDAIKQVLLTPPPPVTQFNVVDAMGALIAWIGSSVITGVTFFGAWFRNLYIGGTSAADAKIIADADGNVTINGASITLDKNGVKTVIDNALSPSDSDVQSLQSIDDATGDRSYINPFEFQLDHQSSPGVFDAVATFGATAGGGGLWLIENAAHTIRGTCRIAGGIISLILIDASGQIVVSPDSGLTVNGNNAVDPSGDVFASTRFTASGASGISTTDALVTSISVSTSSISYAAGTNTATFVDGVSTSTSSAGYTGGIRTS